MAAHPLFRLAGEAVPVGLRLAISHTLLAKLWLQRTQSSDEGVANVGPDAIMRMILPRRWRQPIALLVVAMLGRTSPQNPCAKTHGIWPKRSRKLRRTAPG